jgi:hypothetical protein
VTNKTKDTIAGLATVIVLAVGIFIYSEFQAARFRKRILENPVYTTGKVTSIKYANKHGYIVSFTYSIDFRSFSSTANGIRYGKLRDVIVSRSFPVIANAVDPELCNILVFPEDFKNYNLKMSDSLQWVLELDDQ